MSLALKGALQGDPRRPEEFVAYKKAAGDEDTPDAMQMVALILAMGSVMLKAKLLSWVALFVAISCAAQAKGTSGDAKQIVTSIT